MSGGTISRRPRSQANSPHSERDPPRKNFRDWILRYIRSAAADCNERTGRLARCRAMLRSIDHRFMARTPKPKFFGRLSENFKMANGTWVLAGNLRTTILNRMGGVLQDLAIGGENRDSLIALVWLNPDRARQHATGVARTASAENLVADPAAHHSIH